MLRHLQSLLLPATLPRPRPLALQPSATCSSAVSSTTWSTDSATCSSADSSTPDQPTQPPVLPPFPLPPGQRPQPPALPPFLLRPGQLIQPLVVRQNPQQTVRLSPHICSSTSAAVSAISDLLLPLPSTHFLNNGSPAHLVFYAFRN